MRKAEGYELYSRNDFIGKYAASALCIDKAGDGGQAVKWLVILHIEMRSAVLSDTTPLFENDL